MPLMEMLCASANASYYVGKGEYELFVVNGDQLLKRKVQLGDSNYEYVEVVSGLEPGDQVIPSPTWQTIKTRTNSK